MSRVASLRSLFLLLTDRCNFECSFCYQGPRRDGRMDESVLRAALDFALMPDGEGCELVFTGGEPLLEYDRIRDIVRHCESRAGGAVARFALISNGALMTAAMSDFFAERDMELQISVSGYAPAGGRSGRSGGSSLHDLARVLSLIRSRHPRYYRRRLRCVLVLTPDNAAELASRVEFLLGQEVARIGVTPSVLASPERGPAAQETLATQLRAIWRMLAPWRERASRLPFLPFRGGLQQADGGFESARSCSAERALSPAVDVDGRVYACAAFAGWNHSGEPGFGGAAAEIACLGDIREPGFARTHAAFRLSKRLESLPQSRKRAAGYSCESCRAAGACLACPASWLLGQPTPSAFLCDFLRSCAEYRRRLDAPSNLHRWLAGRGLLT